MLSLDATDFCRIDECLQHFSQHLPKYLVEDEIILSPSSVTKGRSVAPYNEKDSGAWSALQYFGKE